jgi:hypothetical protein
MAAIGVGLIMTLGILGLGIFLAVRKVRGRRDSGRVRTSGDPDPAEPESHETGSFGRAFPSGTLSIDFKPVIGVGFLVALAVLVRRFRRD